MIPPIRHKTAHFLVDLFSCFLLPAYTLLFSGSRQWLSTNFSVLAVMGKDHYRGFFFWGLLAGSYFLFSLLDLSRDLPSPCARLSLRLLSLGAIFCLTAALVLPYLPAAFPHRAQLHTLLAFSSCVLLMAAVLFLLLADLRAETSGCRLRFLWWWSILAGAGALFCMGGMVSSALEIFFTLSTSLLLRSLWLNHRLAPDS